MYGLAKVDRPVIYNTNAFFFSGNYQRMEERFSEIPNMKYA